MSDIIAVILIAIPALVTLGGLSLVIWETVIKPLKLEKIREAARKRKEREDMQKSRGWK